MRARLRMLVWSLVCLGSILASEAPAAGCAGVNGTVPHAAAAHGQGQKTVFTIMVFLMIGAFTSYVRDKTPLPFTVMLLIIGFIFGAVTIETNYTELTVYFEGLETIDPHLMLMIFLPVLIFESAFNIEFHMFKRSFVAILALAVPGVLISTLCTAAWTTVTFVNYKQMDFRYHLLLGSILAATDPVAVVALLRELGASKKLATLIEGESLLNDGTAIVVFSVLETFIIEGTTSVDGTMVGNIIWQFLKIALGGALFGLLAGIITTKMLGKIINNDVVEITILLVCPYITFFIAEEIKVSGVLAVTMLGVYVNVVGRTLISRELEHFLHEFYEMMGFIANTIIFLIVGVIAYSVFRKDYADAPILLLLWVGIHIVRGFATFTVSPILRHTGYGLPFKEAAVLVYGGLRGAVGLALGLIARNSMKPIPVGLKSLEWCEANREDSVECFDVGSKILFHVTGIVLLTLIVNGSTTGLLLKYFGMSDPPPAKLVMIRKSIINLRDETAKKLAKMQLDPFLKDANWNQVTDLAFLPPVPEIAQSVTDAEVGIEKAERRISNMEKKDGRGVNRVSMKQAEDMKAFAVGYNSWLKTEKQIYWKMFNEGVLGRDGVRKLTTLLDSKLDAADSLLAFGEIEELIMISGRLHRVHNRLGDWPFIGEYFRAEIFTMLFTGFDIGFSVIRAQRELQARVSPIFSQRHYGEMWAKVREHFLPEGKRMWMRLSTGISAGMWSKKKAETATTSVAIIQNRDVATHLIKESEGVIKDTEMFLDTLRRAYPDIAVAIKSTLAANGLLRFERQVVNTMKSNGTLDQQEWEHLVNGMRKCVQRLNRGIMAKLPHNYELISRIPWVRGSNHDAPPRQIPYHFLKNLNEMTFNEGHTIFEPGDDPNGIYLLTRGLAHVSIHGSIVHKLMPGSVVGQWSFLTSMKRSCTVVAETYLYALQLTPQFMKNLFEFSREIHGDLWHEVLVQTALLQAKLELIRSGKDEEEINDVKLTQWAETGELKNISKGAVVEVDAFAIVIQGQVVRSELGQEVRMAMQDLNPQDYPVAVTDDERKKLDDALNRNQKKPKFKRQETKTLVTAMAPITNETLKRLNDANYKPPEKVCQAPCAIHGPCSLTGTTFYTQVLIFDWTPFEEQQNPRKGKRSVMHSIHDLGIHSRSKSKPPQDSKSHKPMLQQGSHNSIKRLSMKPFKASGKPHRKPRSRRPSLLNQLQSAQQVEATHIPLDNSSHLAHSILQNTIPVPKSSAASETNQEQKIPLVGIDRTNSITAPGVVGPEGHHHSKERKTSTSQKSISTNMDIPGLKTSKPAPGSAWGDNANPSAPVSTRGPGQPGQGDRVMTPLLSDKANAEVSGGEGGAQGDDVVKSYSVIPGSTS